MKNAKPLLLGKIVEIIVDAFLVLLAFADAYWVRIGQFYSTDFPFWNYFSLALLITPAFLFLLAWSNLYALKIYSTRQLLRITSFASLSGTMLFVLIFFFQREFFFSRLIVLLVFLFATLFLFSFHFGLQKLQASRHKHGKNILRTLIIGNGRVAEQVIYELKSSGNRLFPVAALAPYGGKKEVAGIPVLGKLDALESIIEEQNIEAIIQTEAGEQLINLLLFSEGHFLEYTIHPALFGAFRNSLLPQNIGKIPVLSNKISPLFGWGQVAKYASDTAISFVIVILFSPLFLTKKLKKKEMATGPKEDIFQKYEFEKSSGLTKYLPEFINVLKGEMSLVGPRPRSHKERENLKLHERRRLLVKPGIFGPWQLERLKNTEEDTKRAIEMDTKYIFNWSYGNDISILGKSIVYLLKR